MCRTPEVIHYRVALPYRGVAECLGVTIDQRVASREQRGVRRVAFNHVAQLAEVVDQQSQASLVLVGRLQRLQQIGYEILELGFLDFERDLERAIELDSGRRVGLRLLEQRAQPHDSRVLERDWTWLV